jgi:hypothetical protein
MRRLSCPASWLGALCLAVLLIMPSSGLAQKRSELPDLSSPLRLADVLAYAQAHRPEIVAARARVRAASERPAKERKRERQ